MKGYSEKKGRVLKKEMLHLDPSASSGYSSSSSPSSFVRVEIMPQINDEFHGQNWQIN